LHVTGSIKFDTVSADRGNAKTRELRAFFGIADSERVFIAGSTQEPEESYALETYMSLRLRFPELRLIIVPRHKDRFDEVARLIQARGVPLIRRSQAASKHALLSGIDGNGQRPVALLDTLGELAACWGLADVAFVGGSLTNRGGQNMIEPAAYGATLLFGPNTQNFRDVVELLASADAARIVRDGNELTWMVSDCLANPDRARAQGLRAQKLVLEQQGATARTVEIIGNLSCFSGAAQSSDAAQAA
jgi:3-deoxy-D-manno-octulosonic-acid transferase